MKKKKRWWWRDKVDMCCKNDDVSRFFMLWVNKALMNDKSSLKVRWEGEQRAFVICEANFIRELILQILFFSISSSRWMNFIYCHNGLEDNHRLYNRLFISATQQSHSLSLSFSVTLSKFFMWKNFPSIFSVYFGSPWR